MLYSCYGCSVLPFCGLEVLCFLSMVFVLFLLSMSAFANFAFPIVPSNSSIVVSSKTICSWYAFFFFLLRFWLRFFLFVSYFSLISFPNYSKLFPFFFPYFILCSCPPCILFFDFVLYFLFPQAFPAISSSMYMVPIFPFFKIQHFLDYFNLVLFYYIPLYNLVAYPGM